MPPSGQYIIDILDVALDVIEGMLQNEPDFQRVSDLAKQLDINRSRVYRILKTLEQRGYVDFDPHSQGYQLGLKFVSIAEGILGRIDLRREAEPILNELAQETGDVAHLMVLYGHSAVCIQRFQGDHMLQVATPIGKPLPLHIGASPKLLLAYLPKDERENIIEQMDLIPFTPNTIKSKDQLRRCLEEIRANGYVVDEQDFECGVYAIGAPVMDHNRCVVAGITLTTPESRYKPQIRDKLIQEVVKAAKKLSGRLGYQHVDDGQEDG